MTFKTMNRRLLDGSYLENLGIQRQVKDLSLGRPIDPYVPGLGEASS